jgi:hypothetical protein
VTDKEPDLTPVDFLRVVLKMRSRCFGIMGGHGNFGFNLVVKLSVELGFSKFEVINSVNV